MHTDLRGAKINGKIEIPKGWVRVKTKDELGYMYKNPRNPHEYFKISSGNPKNPNPPSQIPNIQIKLPGGYKGSDGIVRPSNMNKASHIEIINIEF